MKITNTKDLISHYSKTILNYLQMYENLFFHCTEDVKKMKSEAKEKGPKGPSRFLPPSLYVPLFP